MSGVDPGTLRHRVEIRTRHIVIDPETGSAMEAYSGSETVWAALSAVSITPAADSAGARLRRRRTATLRAGPTVKPEDRVIAEGVAWRVAGLRADAAYLALDLEDVAP